jgi:hypothetical protein
MSDNAIYVIGRIESAFAGVTLDGGISLREADVIDDFGTNADRRRARAQDEHSNWMQIPDALIAHYYWCLAFFDARGMRFHLPAYMRFSLLNFRNAESNSIDFTIYACGRNKPHFAAFSGPQKAAVRHFLKFMAFNGGRHVDSGAARQALAEVWLANLR